MNTQVAIPAGLYKLKSFVFFGLVDEGVWFEAGKQSFLLPNRALYPVAERFVSLLDAGYPIEEIIDRAPENIAPIFLKIFDSLRQHQMLGRIEDEHVSLRERAEAKGATSVLALLEDHFEGHRLTDAFGKWLQADVVVVGNGHSARTAKKLFEQGGVASAKLIGTEVGSGGEAGDFEAYDLAVFVADKAEPADLDHWAERFEQAQICSVLAFNAGERGLIVPQDPNGRSRVAALLESLPEPAEFDMGYASLATLGAVAGQIAIERFLDLTSESKFDTVQIVTPTLEIERHPLVPSPCVEGPRAAPFKAPLRREMPDARPLEIYEQVSLSLEPWFDDLFGPFNRVEQAGLLQVPLMQQQIEVGHGSDPATVNGWGLDLGAAGLRAIEAAIEQLCRPITEQPIGLAVSLDREDWRPLAKARLLGSLPTMDAEAWTDIDSERLEDPELALMLRLLRYYRSEAPQIAAVQLGEGEGWKVRVQFAGEFADCAIGVTQIDAAIRAIGAFCARDQWLASGLEIPEALRPHASELIGDVPLSQDAEVQFEELSGYGLPAGIACGVAKFAEGEA